MARPACGAGRDQEGGLWAPGNVAFSAATRELLRGFHGSMHDDCFEKLLSRDSRVDGERGSDRRGCPERAAFRSNHYTTFVLMMKEAHLTNLQQRHLNAKIANGESLPLSSHAPTSARRRKDPPPRARSTLASRARPHLRPASDCMAGEAYKREQYRPKPGKNTEAEKQRLQNLMATGQANEPGETQRSRLPRTLLPPEPEPDRFMELMEEIEARRAFLQEMEMLGKNKQYAPLIHSQISQKIREMEEIDHKRTMELTALLEENEERH